jgi:hypothetical protein
MSDTAKALASPAEFEWEGVTYSLKPLNFYMLGKFTTWLEGLAWEAAERAKNSLSPESHKALLRGISSDIACRLYEPGGPYWLKAEDSRSGQLKILELMTAHNIEEDKEITPEMAVDMWLNGDKRDELQRKMGALNSDPKVIRGMMIPTNL